MNSAYSRLLKVAIEETHRIPFAGDADLVMEGGRVVQQVSQEGPLFRLKVKSKEGQLYFTKVCAVGGDAWLLASSQPFIASSAE